MSRSEEAVVDAWVRLIDAIVSVRLSLAYWLIKKSVGEPAARALIQAAQFYRIYLRRQVFTELRRIPAWEVIQLMVDLLPHKRRRRSLKQMKRKMVSISGKKIVQEFSGELLSYTSRLDTERNADQEPIADRLYPELQCNLNTLWDEPWRAEKAFPINILNSPREQGRLQYELGYEANNYARQLISIIWQLGNNPYSLGLPAPRSNDLIFEVAEQKPSANITGQQAGRAFVNLLRALGDEREAKALFQHGMARILRHQFSLSQNRNTKLFCETEERQKVNKGGALVDTDSEPWEPEDILSLRGYEEVDYRLEYEALRNRLPREQKVALDVYLEKIKTGESIETICARRKLSAVTVRNNFQAVKRKFAADKI